MARFGFHGEGGKIKNKRLEARKPTGSAPEQEDSRLDRARKAWLPDATGPGAFSLKSHGVLASTFAVEHKRADGLLPMSPVSVSGFRTPAEENNSPHSVERQLREERALPL